VFSQIAIPKFASERLALSDVTLETGPIGQSLLAPGIPVTTAQTTRRTFASTDRARVFFEIYQGIRRTDAIAPASVQVKILDARGSVVRNESLTFEVDQFRDRRADCRFDLPLEALTPGEYLLEIAATAVEAKAARRLRFTVR
jgi:hypothetical protein